MSLGVTDDERHLPPSPVTPSIFLPTSRERKVISGFHDIRRETSRHTDAAPSSQSPDLTEGYSIASSRALRPRCQRKSPAPRAEATISS